MSFIKKRLTELSKIKMNISYDEAERQATKFTEKMAAKLQKHEYITLAEEQKTELKQFVFWQFMDYGATWFLQKEPMTKFKAFTDQYLKEIGAT
jgi:hypothetical protein